jgi:Kef-type K+ transport system membrane component KefB
VTTAATTTATKKHGHSPPRFQATGEDDFSSLNLSVAMNARGGPGIVVASTAFAAGIIDSNFFAVLVLLAILTSLAAGAWLERVPRHKLLTRPDEAIDTAARPAPEAVA